MKISSTTTFCAIVFPFILHTPKKESEQWIIEINERRAAADNRQMEFSPFQIEFSFLLFKLIIEKAWTGRQMVQRDYCQKSVVVVGLKTCFFLPRKGKR
jgi:hypothetical protein